MPVKIPEGAAEHLVNLYLPDKWKIRHSRATSRDRDGFCSYQLRTIFCAPVTDDYTLAVFLHEVAHANMHCKSMAPSHVEEYEAERWAMEILRKHGFRVTREILDNAKDNVWTCFLKDKIKKRKADQRVLKWANPKERAYDRKRYLKRIGK